MRTWRKLQRHQPENAGHHDRKAKMSKHPAGTQCCRACLRIGANCNRGNFSVPVAP